MNKKVSRHLLYLGILLIAGILISMFPLFKPGVSGLEGDLKYHLLRIEGVKEALLNGAFPTKIYEFFFNGYGYGSPLFYPDYFLVIPAVLRIIGLSTFAAYKVSLAIYVGMVIISSYFSFLYITKKDFCAFLGTGMVVLSQFYLADLLIRDGCSSYISYIFLPILFAAIYDFFVFGGKKVYLFGVAFVGLLMSHSINSFLSFVVTGIIFICMLFRKKYRDRLFAQIVPLILTAVVSIALISFYVFPLLEQTLWGEFNFKKPWAFVGDNTLPIKVLLFTLQSSFFHVNHIPPLGIGVPILLMSAVCLIPLFIKKNNKELSLFFVLLGIVLFVIMNDIFPWRLLNNTIFNMIQFTFRLFPYAIMSTVVGLMLYFSKFEFDVKGKALWAGCLMFVLTCVFGVVQNMSVTIVEDTLNYTEEYLAFINNKVGMGEWFPLGIDDLVVCNGATRDVTDSDGNSYEWTRNSYLNYSFDIEDESVEAYRVPLMAYKGYKAKLLSSDGSVYKLPTYSEKGVVWLSNPDMQTGHVTVWYGGTTVQMISNILSIFTAIGLIAYVVYRRKTNKAD